MAKSQLYLEFLPLLFSGKVQLLDNPRLTSQLISLERRAGRTGRDIVDHPPHCLDDVANAVAGAIVSCSSGVEIDYSNALTVTRTEVKNIFATQSLTEGSLFTLPMAKGSGIFRGSLDY